MEYYLFWFCLRSQSINQSDCLELQESCLRVPYPTGQDPILPCKMWRTRITASINFLSNLIFKEIHELTCQEGDAYALSLFLSQTLHRIEKKLEIVSIQVDDTGKVGVPHSSQCTLIGEQTVVPCKMKDLKFSRAPFSFKDSAALLQGVRFFIKPGSWFFQ